MRQRNRSIGLKPPFDCYAGSANCRVATWCEELILMIDAAAEFDC